jgi:hypothetical protein
VFAQRGVVNLAQMKFNFIPGKGSNNIPLSVTWSNRTVGDSTGMERSGRHQL